MSLDADPWRGRCLRVTDVSALVGAVVWLWFRTATADFIEVAIGLAVLVLVPLLLHLTVPTPAAGRLPLAYAAALLVQPFAGLLVPISFLLPEGLTAGMLVVPWLGVTVCIGLYGLWRLSHRGPAPLSELTIDAGLLYMAVGSVALVLHRLGLGFLQFGALLVLLAAMHFHFAGLTLPVLCGVAARILPDDGRVGRVVEAALWVVIVGPLLILLGITFSPLVEVIAVGFFTVAVAAFSVCVLGSGLSRRESWLQRLLVGVSAISIVVSMGFAFAFGWSAFSGTTLVTISEMIRWHGRLNALGFALFGALGWRIDVPSAPST